MSNNRIPMANQRQRNSGGEWGYVNHNPKSTKAKGGKPKGDSDSNKAFARENIRNQRRGSYEQDF